MSANLQFYIIIRFADFRGLSRTFADAHKIMFLCFVYYEKMSAKVRECPRMSTKIHNNTSPRMSTNIRESPRYNFIQAKIRGLSRTFEELCKYLCFCLLQKNLRESPADFLSGHSRTFADIRGHRGRKKSARVRRTLVDIRGLSWTAAVREWPRTSASGRYPRRTFADIRGRSRTFVDIRGHPRTSADIRGHPRTGILAQHS